MKYSEKKDRNVRWYGHDTRLHAVRVVEMNRYKSEDLPALKKYVKQRALSAVCGALFGTTKAFNWTVGGLLVLVALCFDMLTAGTVLITGGVWFFLNMSKLPNLSKIKRTNRGELTEDDMRTEMTVLLNKVWIGAVFEAVARVVVALFGTGVVCTTVTQNPMTWFTSWCALGFVFVARIIWFPNVTKAIKEIKGLYDTPFRNHSSVEV